MRRGLPRVESGVGMPAGARGREPPPIRLSPAAKVGRRTARRSRNPAAISHGSLSPKVVAVHPNVPPFSRTRCQNFRPSLHERLYPTLFELPSGVGQCEYSGDTRTAYRQRAHRFGGGGTGGDDVVNKKNVGLTCVACMRSQRDAPGDISFPAAAVESDRVPDEGPHSQSWDDGDAWVGPRCRGRHPGDGVSAAPTGGRASGRGGHDQQWDIEDSPAQQSVNAERERMRQRSDEVGATLLLDRDDRVAPRSGVATECEHRDARVITRGDEMRAVIDDLQHLRTGVTPPGGGGAATAAFQWQDEIEHTWQSGPWG